MTAHLGEAEIGRMRAAGLEALSDEQGLALLGPGARLRPGRPLALNLNFSTLRRAQAGALPAILSGLVRSTGPAPPAAGTSFAARLASLSAAERESIAGNLVRTRGGLGAGHDSEPRSSPPGPSRSSAFDSLAAVELRNGCRRDRVAAGGDRGLRLPQSRRPLRANIVAPRLAARVSASGSRSGQSDDEPIADSRYGCRYPGGAAIARSALALVAAVTCDFELPRGPRLGPGPSLPPGSRHRGTFYTRHGGFLDCAGEFDADFFGIGPAAQAHDPQHGCCRSRLGGARARRHRSPPPSSARAGVFAGVASLGYGIDGCRRGMEDI